MKEIELCANCYKLSVLQPTDWFAVPCVSSMPCFKGIGSPHVQMGGGGWLKRFVQGIFRMIFNMLMHISLREMKFGDVICTLDK